jgi:hypothetical protein
MATRLTCRCVTPLKYVVPRNVQRVLDDLLDNEQIAALLGLSSANAAAVYATKYPDWPPPVVGERGKCPLRLRSHVLQWRERHPSRGEET